jgi:hypothetical protein
MILTLTVLLIFTSIVLIVKAPWWAAALYALVSILQPQYVWFWSFDNFSVFRVTAGVAIVAWGIYLIRGMIDWSIYKNGIFFGIIFLLLLYNLSISELLCCRRINISNGHLFHNCYYVLHCAWPHE